MNDMIKDINKLNISEYSTWLKDIKDKVRKAQLKAGLAINSTLLELYWDIGKDIVAKQENSPWGSGVIEKLANDLRSEFPDIKGFSRRNIYAVRQWYLFYSKESVIVPRSVAQIPWRHNRLIISKIKNVEEALFYAQSTIENGWSMDVLEIQIENSYYANKGNAITNFNKTLPTPQSDLAKQTIRDPYNFGFLGLEDEAQEREIERELTRRITDFLLELGKGFAFIGRQYKIEVSESDYFIDLLFYHLDLRCYVVIELKAGKFKPEFAGKLNFYLSAVDSQIKKPEDNPTIGIILCKKKDKIEAEYSLRDINKPIGISNYKLSNAIPDNLTTKLPTVEELEVELAEKLKDDKKDDK